MPMIYPASAPIKRHRPPHHHPAPGQTHRRPLSARLDDARVELAWAAATGDAYARDRAQYAEAVLARAAGSYEL